MARVVCMCVLVLVLAAYVCMKVYQVCARVCVLVCDLCMHIHLNQARNKHNSELQWKQ